MYTAADPLLQAQKDTEEFRDHVATVRADGKRAWIYAKKPKGKFYNLRTWVSYVLLALMFAGPYVRIHGQPLLLLNVLERKFIIFGFVFWPQDFYLVVLGLLIMILTIVLFTSVFGRIWCGWACPQTIFLEMLFRKLEYAIEGDFQEQKKLSAAPWTAGKVFRKGGKLIIFYALSFIIANTFLAYIIGSEELWKIITEPVATHIGGFVAINIFTILFFLVFARFREQACHFACPYGRFQSALVDNDTISVTYDFQRGEKRATLGERKKTGDYTASAKTQGDFGKIAGGAGPEISRLYGDCIDCHACVVVCPSGIDIRNGIQLECIQCTACIDACDKMMVATGKPKGLIRYTSINAVQNKSRPKLKFRTIGYTLIWLGLLGAFTTLLFTRDKIEAVLLRQPGMLAQRLPDGYISNLYTLKIFNKTFEAQTATVKIGGVPAEIRLIDALNEIPAQNMAEARFLIAMKQEVATLPNMPVEIEVWSGGRMVNKKRTVFIATGGK